MINTAAGILNKACIGEGLPRSDKTGFTYMTRSYGVGASVGLLPPAAIGNYYNVFGYSYTEIGYEVSISCDFNLSSQWKTSIYQKQLSDYVPNTYICKGSTPDNAMDWYLQYGAINESNIVCINAHPEHGNLEGTGVITIAAGEGSYSPLNNA